MTRGWLSTIVDPMLFYDDRRYADTGRRMGSQAVVNTGPCRFGTWPGEELLDDAMIIAKIVESTRQQSDGCILWMPAGRKLRKYGSIVVGRKFVAGQEKIVQRAAHRVVWELLRGPIQLGRVLDHLCGSKSCVNIQHLEVVTNGENVRRGQYAKHDRDRPSHCKNGHEYAGDNLIEVVVRSGRTQRRCKACMTASAGRAENERWGGL